VTVPAFIGDEVSATAWRLIGVRATAVDKGNAAEAFEAALELDSEGLDAALRNAKPLILLVPDAANRIAPPDLDKEVDRVLGIEQ
jgi:vacuolar-type H+-ATPase subunit F/Vma7